MEARGHYINSQELIEEADAKIRDVEAQLNARGPYVDDSLALVQMRALVAIADTLASIDRRLEELVKAVQGIGVTGL
jgi:hypothetical protein